MSQFDDLLTVPAIRSGLALSGKKQLFPRLGDIAAQAYALDPQLVTERLLEREQLGSTGFGNGVAIPHAKLEGLDQVRGLFISLEAPIGFDAVDDVPVDIIFALLSPVDAGAEHLKALARVSRFLRHDGHLERLRGARSPEALYALLTTSEERDAA